MTELFDTLTLLGALQGAVLALVLLRRRANHLASRILGALVGGVALMLLLGFVERRWGFHGHPHLIGLSMPLPFLFSPLLCLYVLALTRPLERFDRRWLVHGLPFLANLAYLMQAFYLRDGPTKLALAQGHIAGHVAPAMAAFMAVQFVQAVSYLTIAAVALRRHARRMERYYSELAAVDLRWLSVIVLANVAIWLVAGLNDLALAFRPEWPSLEPLVQAGSALFVFLIGYLFLWQPELVQKTRAAQGVVEEAPPAPPEPPQPEERAGEAPRYQRNRIDDGEARSLVEALERLMKEEEPFRDGSLTAQVLADALAITPHLLSQILNVHVGRTFYSFVNEHRTRALMAALEDPATAKRGVLELAFDAGFSSKSTLNSFFKKHTGLTPTEYRQRALEKNRMVPAG